MRRAGRSRLPGKRPSSSLPRGSTHPLRQVFFELRSSCILQWVDVLLLFRASRFPHLRRGCRSEILDFINQVFKKIEEGVKETHVSAKIIQRDGKSVKRKPEIERRSEPQIETRVHEIPFARLFGCFSSQLVRRSDSKKRDWVRSGCCSSLLLFAASLQLAVLSLASGAFLLFSWRCRPRLCFSL